MIYLFHNSLLFLILNYYLKIFCLVAFLVYLLIHICAFYISSHICLWQLVSLYDLTLFLYVFHLTITRQYHPLLLLCCYFYIFLCQYNHFIHTQEKNKSFWWCKCSLLFNKSHTYKLVFLKFTLFYLIFSFFSSNFSVKCCAFVLKILIYLTNKQHS